MTHSPRDKSGFSLVELLAVLAIVIILVVFLFPFARTAIQRFQSARCVGNLKVLGAASASYAADNNGKLPLGYSSDDKDGASFTGPDGEYWYWLVAPYAGVPRSDTVKTHLGPQGGKITRPVVFTCPSHGSNEAVVIKFPTNRPVSYAPSNRLAAFMQTKAPDFSSDSRVTWVLRAADIPYPSKKVWLSDSTFYNILNIGVSRWTATSDQDAWARTSFSRHAGSGNALFFDGHIESISCASVMNENIKANIDRLFDPLKD